MKACSFGMERCRGWLAGWCLLTLLAATAWADPGSLNGRVVAAETSEPLVGASVRVTGPALTGERGAYTDGQGRYAVGNLPAGTYRVAATFVGYQEQVLEGVEVVAGQAATMDLRLQVSPYALGEIVVSASRHAENVVDAPASVSKVDQQAVNRNAIANSLAGLIRGQKGIDYSQRGIFAEGYHARGYNSAYNERMLMFVDGQPYISPISRTVSWPMPKDDIQDIEIITGPAAALYGPDAVSGVISVTTKDPKDTQGTTLVLGGGSQEMVKGRFRHADLHGRWGYKISGEYQRAREFDVTQTYLSADSSFSVTDDPDLDAHSARISAGLSHYPSPQVRIGLAAGASQAKFLDMLDAGRMQDDDLRRYFEQVTYDSPRLRMNLYAIQRDEKALSLPNKARYLLEGMSAKEAEDKVKSGSEEVLWGAEARGRFHLAQFGARLDLGADFRQRREESVILEGGKTVASQVGLYGHSEMPLGPRFRAVLAARVDYHDTYATQFSPKVALLYKPRPEMAFRATYNRAFRSPSTVHRHLVYPINATTVARGNGRGFSFGSLTSEPLPSQFAEGIAKVAPEENETIELGYKGMLASRIYLDLSGYRSRYRNFISPGRLIGDPANGIFVLDENGLPRVGENTLTYINYGKQTVHGFDISVDVHASRRLSGRGSLSLIHPGKFQKLGSLEQPFNTPEATLNLGVSVTDPVGRGSFVDVCLRRVSEYDYRAGINLGTVPAYAVLDANLGYRIGPVTYRVSASNLLDNDHIEIVGGPRIGVLAIGEVEYGF